MKAVCPQPLRAFIHSDITAAALCRAGAGAARDNTTGCASRNYSYSSTSIPRPTTRYCLQGSSNSRSSVRAGADHSQSQLPSHFRLKNIPNHAVPFPFRRYSSSRSAAGPSSQTGPGKSRARFVKYAVIAGVVGGAVLVYKDEIKHTYRAAERTGRVVSTLAVCINE